MPLVYTKAHELREGHSGVVSCVAMSPFGTYLATGGLEGKICLWKVSEGTLLHVVESSTSVLSLCWLTGREDMLMCGLEDGSIGIIATASGTLSITGFLAHKHPVECLAVCGSRVASGARDEVVVWESAANVDPAGQNLQSFSGQWRRLGEPEKPEAIGMNSTEELIVTSLHWAHTPKYGLILVATYMYHGVMLHKATGDFERVGSNHFPGLIGSASVSPDGSLLAISNVKDGFDLFNIDQNKVSHMFYHAESNPGFPLPVLFIHGGSAVVGGSGCGTVHIRETSSKYPLDNDLPSLAPDERILSLTAYCDDASDQYLLALSALNRAGRCRTLIYKGIDRTHTQVQPMNQDAALQRAEKDSESIMLTWVLSVSLLLTTSMLAATWFSVLAR